MKVLITSDTFLKALPAQADEIKNRDIPQGLYQVKAGESLEVVDYEPFAGAPTSEADDHIFVQLRDRINGSDELRWFLYGPHCKIEGTEPGNDPTDKPAVRTAVLLISVPGISKEIPIHQSIYRGSNFTWAELTKGGSRIPVDETVTQRIVKIARFLDGIRSYLGDRPITITSGYRDPYSNRAVGGARDSRHMYGDAVDFYVHGLDVVEVFQRLKHYRGIGGLAVGNGFVHVDLRPGAPARWHYPGGPQVALW